MYICQLDLQFITLMALDSTVMFRLACNIMWACFVLFLFTTRAIYDEQIRRGGGEELCIVIASVTVFCTCKLQPWSNKMAATKSVHKLQWPIIKHATAEELLK